jgi:hypothetical protein
VLRVELPQIVADEEERASILLELDAALELPEGEVERALIEVLKARPDTRAWVAERIEADDLPGDRGIPGLAGTATAPLGVHVVCPNGDYDRYLESAADDPGRCPHDGRRLIVATD